MAYTITLLNSADIQNLPDKDTHPPIFITGTCTKCGKCCQHFDCPANDSVTHLCKVYGNRPIVCRQWPLTQENILLVDCPGYQFKTN